MPSFSFDINEHIDVDEYYSEMDRFEKEAMADMLYEDGYLDGCIIINENHRGVTSGEFFSAIKKLADNYYQLTVEETGILIKMANRF